MGEFLTNQSTDRDPIIRHCQIIPTVSDDRFKLYNSSDNFINSFKYIHLKVIMESSTKDPQKSAECRFVISAVLYFCPYPCRVDVRVTVHASVCVHVSVCDRVTAEAVSVSVLLLVTVLLPMLELISVSMSVSMYMSMLTVVCLFNWCSYNMGMNLNRKMNVSMYVH